LHLGCFFGARIKNRFISQIEYLTVDLYHESTKKTKTRNNYQKISNFVLFNFRVFVVKIKF